VGHDAQSPGVGRALLRVLIYSLPITLPSFALMVTVPLTQLNGNAQLSEWLTGREGSIITDWAWLPLTILLFITMRRRNGYAAVHDLASGTRVIVRPKAERRPALALPPVPPRPPAAEASHFGPYNGSEVLWKRDGEELVLAFDAALQRKIWIHLRPLGAAPVNEARRDLSRPARLRWINRGQTGTHIWDAYEAPDGAPFLALVQRPQPWNAVRFWLLDVAEEMSAALETRDAQPRADLARLWITHSGQAMLLDFAAPGLAPLPLAESAGEPGSQESMQRFLADIARLALEGPAARGGESAKPIAALVPLHAQSFLASLVRGTFEEARFIVGNLRSLCFRTTEISRPRRAASLAFVPLLVIVLGISLAGLVSFERIRWDRAWTAAYPALPSLRSAAELYQHREEVAKFGEREQKDLEAIGVYIVSHYGGLITNASFRDSTVGRLLADSSEQNALERAVKRFAEPTAQQVADAERIVSRRLAKYEREQRFLGFRIAMGMAVFIPALIALIDLIGAAAFGVSPILRLFGMAVVRRDGRPASRWTLILRSLVAWMPFIGGPFLVAGLGSTGLAAIVGTMFVLAGVAVYSVVRPSAGIQDRLLRTRLVAL
jgi:hypothetical protein